MAARGGATATSHIKTYNARRRSCSPCTWRGCCFYSWSMHALLATHNRVAGESTSSVTFDVFGRGHGGLISTHSRCVPCCVLAYHRNKLPNMYCSGTIHSYPSAPRAQQACLPDKNCKGIYDNGCDYKGTWYTCKAGSPLRSKQGSCVYQKSFPEDQQALWCVCTLSPSQLI